MSFQYRIVFEPLRSLPYTSLSGSYVALGPSYSEPARMIKFTNETDADVTLSFDGTTDQDIVPAGTSQVYDFCSNRTTTPNDLLVQPLGTICYVSTSGSPTMGSVYLTVMYAD